MPKRRNRSTINELRRTYDETGYWMENFPCKRCGALRPDLDGHDPCLGKLPGVKFACCGHGHPRRGYIYFENGVIVRGAFARDSEPM